MARGPKAGANSIAGRRIDGDAEDRDIGTVKFVPVLPRRLASEGDEADERQIHTVRCIAGRHRGELLSYSASTHRRILFVFGSGDNRVVLPSPSA